MSSPKRQELGSRLRLTGKRIFQEKLFVEHRDTYSTVGDAFRDATIAWSNIVMDAKNKKCRKRFEQLAKDHNNLMRNADPKDRETLSQKLAEEREEYFEDWDEEEWTGKPPSSDGILYESSDSEEYDTSSVSEDSSEDEEILADGSGTVKYSRLLRENAAKQDADKELPVDMEVENIPLPGNVETEGGKGAVGGKMSDAPPCKKARRDV